jgi:uncharacterized protein YpbB
LVKLVNSKDLDISLFLTSEQILKITDTARRTDTNKLTDIHEQLAGEFEYYKIRMALDYAIAKN